MKKFSLIFGSLVVVYLVIGLAIAVFNRSSVGVSDSEARARKPTYQNSADDNSEKGAYTSTGRGTTITLEEVLGWPF